MKFSTVLLVAGAAVVAAQVGMDGLPDCSKECAAETISASDCGMDPKCFCSNETFLTDIAACVDKGCTAAADRKTTIDFAVDMCKLVGVEIDTGLLPPPASSTSSTPAATSVPIGTAAPSTTPTGSAGGKNDTITTPKPGSDSDDDEDDDAGSDSAAGRVGGSIIGVVAALAGACLLL